MLGSALTLAKWLLFDQVGNRVGLALAVVAATALGTGWVYGKGYAAAKREMEVAALHEQVRVVNRQLKAARDIEEVVRRRAAETEAVKAANLKLQEENRNVVAKHPARDRVCIPADLRGRLRAR